MKHHARENARVIQPELFTDITPVDKLLFEKLKIAEGFLIIAGVDEAGRGPLAGPVVAAAVVLDMSSIPEGIDDSKKLSATARARLYPEIMMSAKAVSHCVVSEETIDRINILQSTLLAMKSAVSSLSSPPDFILVDGNVKIPDIPRQQTLVKGDSRSLSIAAASIIAKVMRDRIMLELDALYPQYGFARNMGYGTREHLEAVSKFGPTPVHRKTFAGVKEHLDVTSIRKP